MPAMSNFMPGPMVLDNATLLMNCPFTLGGLEEMTARITPDVFSQRALSSKEILQIGIWFIHLKLDLALLHFTDGLYDIFCNRPGLRVGHKTSWP